MSKEDLYRVAADGNPSQIEKLPQEPLDFEFPITTKSSLPLKLWRFLGHLFMVSGVTVLLPLTLAHDAMIFGLFMAYIVINLLIASYQKIGPKIASRAFSALLVVHFSFYLSYKCGYSYMAWLMAFSTLLYTLNIARLFRSHWVHRASCGMLTKAEIANFRQRGQLPAGVHSKATLPAFIAALRSWANYDPHNAQAAGLMKCPSGEAQDRYAASICLSILWSGVLVSPQSIQYLSLLGNPFLILPFFLLTIPVGLPYLLMFLFSADVLGKAHALMDYQFEPKRWTPFLDQIRTSQNLIEQESLYLGRVHGDGSPILYPADRMMRGGWIQGSPGSGKTLLLMQVIEQLVQLGYSVVTLDCKATSHELLWGAHAAIERVQRNQGRFVPLYPFTPVHGKPSYLLDIYSQPFWKARSPEEKASILLGFFGLNGPQRYGESWFRDAAWTVKQHVTSKCGNLRSFHEAANKLYEELRHAKEWELSASVKGHGEHPGLILRRLGLVDALNVRQGYSQQILDSSLKLESLFQKPSVLHCSLPAVSDPIGNPEVGRVILSSLMATAAHLPKRPVKVVVIIDEFQRMVARSLDLILQQARSRGVGVLLTNQSSADLVAVDKNMPGTIAGNTAMQAWIKATDGHALQQVQNYGGQYIDHLISRSVSTNTKGQSSSVTRSEQILDRVSTGLIDRVNSSHDQYFLRLTDDGGYATFGGQMFAAQMGYHTDSPEEYERRVQAAWPPKLPGMLVNGEHRPSPGPPASSLLGPNKRKPSTGRRPTSLGKTP